MARTADSDRRLAAPAEAPAPDAPVLFPVADTTVPKGEGWLVEIKPWEEGR